MELHLYNTLTRSKELFAPLEPPRVRLYTCGPTVYHYAHIGNLRTYVFEDILVRALERAGYDVDHVMNITDVGHLVSDGDDGEDKMEKGARREGRSAWDIATYYTEAFFKDLERLNVRRPRTIPKATDHIAEMIALVQELEAKGYTYRTEDGIYFDTTRFKAYGEMAKLDLDNLAAGKRVQMRDKRNPTDFALWKFSPAGEQRQMEWDSPWGKGFPGWHIECSAMSMKYLGQTLDIHCGGKDHIPVHHTNEIAQSEAATGAKFSRWWMHGEFLNSDKGKMAKSGAEFLTLQLLLDKGYSAMDYRFLLLQAHYRTELTFSFAALDSAKAGWAGIRERFADWRDLDAPVEMRPELQQYRDRFDAAVADDLNIPMALSVLFAVVKDEKLHDAEKRHLLCDFDTILGLGLPEAIAAAQAGTELPAEIQQMMQARDQARAAKDFAESDRLRDELIARGYHVLDTREGTRVKRKAGS